MTTGVVVLLVAVVAALAFGGYRRVSDGRFRGARGPAAPVASSASASASEPAPEVRSLPLAGTPWQHDLGERATLLQFSSAFCAPCRATRRTLQEVARIVPGVVHVEVDAEHHLDLVRRVGIVRTPTTLVLDAEGREVSRAGGAPTAQAVIAGLGPLA